MKFEKILILVILLNALINLFLILSYTKKKKDKLSFDDFMFFRGYIYFIPFFLTRSIIKEINEKENKTRIRNSIKK